MSSCVLFYFVYFCGILLLFFLNWESQWQLPSCPDRWYIYIYIFFFPHRQITNAQPNTMNANARPHTSNQRRLSISGSKYESITLFITSLSLFRKSHSWHFLGDNLATKCNFVLPYNCILLKNCRCLLIFWKCLKCIEFLQNISTCFDLWVPTVMCSPG